MIDKNFYLENLSAFDILILDDRDKAQEVIFRVYSILQRDKIWLNEVATPEEIFEEDAELLEEVEEELQELDEKYQFKFREFYDIVQQKIKKNQANSSQYFSASDPETAFLDPEEEEEDDDFHIAEEDEIDVEDELDLNEYDVVNDEDESDLLSHLSEEELDLVTDLILQSAKIRIGFSRLVAQFPLAEEYFLEEEFLLPLIAGKAYAETDAEIAGPMLSGFIMQGYELEMSELRHLIAEKSNVLGKEILAFQVAAEALQSGEDPNLVVQQIELLLK